MRQRARSAGGTAAGLLHAKLLVSGDGALGGVTYCGLLNIEQSGRSRTGLVAGRGSGMTGAY